MKRLIYLLALSTLMLPGSTFAASKEQQEMQRDIAQLQDQVRTLQSSFDQKLATLETLVAQALDAGNKTNTNVSVLSSSVTQTLDRELKDAAAPGRGGSPPKWITSATIRRRCGEFTGRFDHPDESRDPAVDRHEQRD